MHKVHPQHEIILSSLGEVLVLSNMQESTHRESRKMKKQGYVMFQTKEPDKPSEIYLNDLPDKEFNIMVIMILTKVRKIMYEESENFTELKVLNRNHRAEE